ncbi:MAG: hypothetical protein ACO3QC_11645 [Phycisphaerales bacterium]
MPALRNALRKPPRAAAAPLADVEEVGRALAHALEQVVSAPATRAHGASALSVRLKFSRVLISRILNALKNEEPLETLQLLPGPESLRTFVHGMGRLGVAAARVKAALEAIERFDALIRVGFGTRGKFNAAICSHAPSMRSRQELTSRQRVFAGMRELRGGEAETWLATHMLAPDRDDPSKLNARILQGFIGLRQLRTDTTVYFDFMPSEEPSGAHSAAADGSGLEEFYANPPARIETTEVDGRKVSRLAPGQIGKEFLCDMLSLTRIAGAMPRLARSPGRRTGSFALIKTPVKLLHLDIILPAELTDGSAPELFVFAPGPRSCTNVNDRIDDLDRVDVSERIEVLDSGPERFEVPAVPNYRRMLEKMAGELGQDLDAMRVLRLSVAYPPFGDEFVSTFRLRSGDAKPTK